MFTCRCLMVLVLCCNLATAATEPLFSGNIFEGKRVLHINAYHEGYAWSDGIQKTIEARLKPSRVTLQTMYMDTKRNKSNDYARNKGLEAKALIDSWKPDVVIVSDDNPMRWVIAPFYKNSSLPCVFCGINYDGREYGLPFSNTCGMYEVDLVAPCIEQLAKYAKGKRLCFLAGDNETNRRIGAETGKTLQAKGFTYTDLYVHNWREWQINFQILQTDHDLLLFMNSGINDWPTDGSAEAFHERESHIPSGFMQEENAPFGLLGYTKIPAEQGEFAANATLKILQGSRLSDIGESSNKKARIMLNLKIAKTLGIKPDVALLKQATLIK